MERILQLMYLYERSTALFVKIKGVMAILTNINKHYLCV